MKVILYGSIFYGLSVILKSKKKVECRSACLSYWKCIWKPLEHVIVGMEKSDVDKKRVNPLTAPPHLYQCSSHFSRYLKTPQKTSNLLIHLNRWMRFFLRTPTIYCTSQIEFIAHRPRLSSICLLDKLRFFPLANK